MNATTGVLWVALAAWQLVAGTAHAQTDFRLIDAERSYEFGEYKLAADELESLAKGAHAGESRAALRMLALIYSESGAPHRAAEAARKFLAAADNSPLGAADRLEMLSVLAEALAEQGDWEHAAEELKTAINLLEASGGDGSVRMLRIRSRLVEVAERLQRVGVDLPHDLRLIGQASPEQYRNANLYPVLRQLVESDLQRGQPATAIARLTPVMEAQRRKAPGAQGLSQEQACEVLVLYARCLAASEKRENAARAVEQAIKAFADWRGLLRDDSESLGLPEAERELADARAVQRIGDLLEWRAELASAGEAQFSIRCLRKAWGAFSRVEEACEEISAAHQALVGHSPAAGRRAALDQRVVPLKDNALSGVQRVTTRLLEADELTSTQRARLSNARLDASQQLIALREARLLPDDPRLTQARRAMALILLDEGKPVEAAEQLQRLGDELAQATHVERTQVAENKLSYSTALIAASLPADAKEVLLNAPPVDEQDPLLQARIESLIGLASVLLGDYRVAESRLGKASSLASSVAGDSAGVESQTVLYRALLLKSQARYNDAVKALNEGRGLRMKSPRTAAKHQVAYNLVEASIHLSAIADRVNDSLTRSDRLSRVVHLLQTSRQVAESESLGASVAENLELLECYSLAQNGKSDRARGKLAALAEGEGNSVRTRALAELALAQFSLKNSNGMAALSGPVQHTQQLRAALRHTQAASEYLKSAGENAYPSLQFKAAFQTAQLHAGLDRLGDSLKRLPEPLEGDSEQLASYEAGQSHVDAAIEQLQHAVKLAERPAGSNTLKRQERSQFFTRYAAAYDMLVDLLTRKAVGDSPVGEAIARSEQPDRHAALVQAISVADQARNRTFREQLAVLTGQESSGGLRLNDDLRRILRPDEAMIVFQLSGLRRRFEDSTTAAQSAGSYLYVVLDQGDTIHAFPLHDESHGGAPLTRQAAASLVSAFVSDLSELPTNRQRQFLAENREQKLKTTESLLPAAARRLLQRSTRLVIVPDGALHQLPFEALVVRSGGSVGYAIDQLPPTVYGPSLSVLAAIDPTPRSAEVLNVVTLGGADFGGPEIPAWRTLAERTGIDKLEPLPATQAECQRVYDSFARLPNTTATLLLGADATESAVRTAAVRAGVLHLATHAVVDPENDNLYGAVALTPDPTPGDATPGDASHDGLLHLSELYDLDLSACHLAILSACQTLIGADRPLEAGMSFSRAMLEVGARRVVASQWSINDQATSQLVADFSERVSAGLAGDANTDYCQALHDAKRELKGALPDPYFWAPLVLVGAP